MIDEGNKRAIRTIVSNQYIVSSQSGVCLVGSIVVCAGLFQLVRKAIPGVLDYRFIVSVVFVVTLVLTKGLLGLPGRRKFFKARYRTLLQSISR